MGQRREAAGPWLEDSGGEMARLPSGVKSGGSLGASSRGCSANPQLAG